MARTTQNNYGTKPAAPGSRIYIREDGDDANNGFINDAANAVKTINGAYDVMRKYDWSAENLLFLKFEPSDTIVHTVLTSSVFINAYSIVGLQYLVLDGEDDEFGLRSNLSFGTHNLNISGFTQVSIDEMRWTQDEVDIFISNCGRVDFDQDNIIDGCTNVNIGFSYCGNVDFNGKINNCTNTIGNLPFVNFGFGCTGGCNIWEWNNNATNGNKAHIVCRMNAHMFLNAIGTHSIASGRWFELTFNSGMYDASGTSNERVNFTGNTVADIIDSTSVMDA